MSADNLHTILIDVQDVEDVDNLTTLGCIEYVITHNCLRQSRHRASTPDVSILTTDIRPEEYEPLCDRFLIPSDCVLDGYSQWYPHSSDQSQKIHISKAASLRYEPDRTNSTTTTTTTTTTKAPLFNLIDKLIKQSQVNKPFAPSSSSPFSPTGSGLKETIIVIDSLSSLIRYTRAPVVKSYVALRNYLYDHVSTKHTLKNEVLTFIATVRSQEIGSSQASLLANLFDTHVTLYQSSQASDATPLVLANSTAAIDNQVFMDVRRRKPSGRVAFSHISARIEESTGCFVDDNVTSVNELKSEDRGKDVAQPEDELELAERGLTFRLSLSSKEREMRAAAGLPYLHQDEAVADTALELHPASLQIGEEGEYDFDEGDSDIEEDDEGELFSEDV